LNFLLSLNKKYVLLITLIISATFLFFFGLKYYFNLDENIEDLKVKVSSADITKPRFAINSDSQKISVTANEGNFIDKDKILLKNNVKFESNNFRIETDNVVFDRKNQTAKSNDKSKFKSKNTIISSEGFNIYDNGSKIKFYGNSTVILK